MCLDGILHSWLTVWDKKIGLLDLQSKVNEVWLITVMRAELMVHRVMWPQGCTMSFASSEVTKASSCDVTFDVYQIIEPFPHYLDLSCKPWSTFNTKAWNTSFRVMNVEYMKVYLFILPWKINCLCLAVQASVHEVVPFLSLDSIFLCLNPWLTTKNTHVIETLRRVLVNTKQYNMKRMQQPFFSAVCLQVQRGEAIMKTWA